MLTADSKLPTGHVTKKDTILALSYCSMDDLKREKKIKNANEISHGHWTPNKPLINHHCLLIRQTLINNCDFLHTDNGLLKMIPSEKKTEPNAFILHKKRSWKIRWISQTNEKWPEAIIVYNIVAKIWIKKNNKYVTIFELE